jgi:hypothetical protein
VRREKGVGEYNGEGNQGVTYGTSKWPIGAFEIMKTSGTD